jgi:hypothetical protein
MTPGIHASVLSVGSSLAPYAIPDYQQIGHNKTPTSGCFAYGSQHLWALIPGLILPLLNAAGPAVS